MQIEAKFGRFVDRGSGERIALPVLTETVLAPGSWYRFDAVISPAQHSVANRALNGLVGPDRRWQYKHSKAVDFFAHNAAGQRVRITMDEGRSRVVESMVKERLADLAIFMPNRPLDVRISVNSELPAAPPSTSPGDSEVERFKDRRSYLDTATSLQFDLTEVTQRTGGRMETKLELEVESKDPAALIADPATFIRSIRKFASQVLK